MKKSGIVLCENQQKVCKKWKIGIFAFFPFDRNVGPFKNAKQTCHNRRFTRGWATWMRV